MTGARDGATAGVAKVVLVCRAGGAEQAPASARADSADLSARVQEMVAPARIAQLDLYRFCQSVLAQIGGLDTIHQRLAELTTYQHHALVIEALYADFLNPKKLYYYSTSFCAQAIGKMYALHPRLNIVFCANRKMAREWTRHYFTAIWEEIEAERQAETLTC